MSYSLSDWRNNPNPDDFIIAKEIHEIDGEYVEAYHIFNIVRRLSHIIESQSVVREIVTEMSKAGVKVVTMEEALQILYGDRLRQRRNE